MIDRLVELALNRRLLVWVVAIAVAIFGYYSWTQLALEAYPDIADVTSQVITQAPGLAAEEVEQQITVPLERELNGTPGLLMMRSKSTFGLSLITLVFRDGVEDYWARQRISERLQNVTLPDGVSPGLDPLTSPIGEIYRYTLESSTKGLRELSELQRWTIIPALKQVAGVADVSNFGGVTTQFQLELDPAQLMRFNVSLKNVTDAIESNSSNSGGSVLTRGELDYVIRGVGLVQTLEDMGNIVVAQRGGSPIFVHDLGKLKLSNQERRGILGKDQRNDAISGIVLLLRGENPSRVLEGVHAKVDELNATLEASDVRIAPYLDRSGLVDATVEKVSRTVFEGIGLVLIILILFLGSPRGALIVGMTVPFAMLAAFSLMNLTRVPANLLSLGAIDFGIIVDASIVMAEAVLRRREAKPDDPLTALDMRETATQVARPIFFATLVIIVTYLPLFAFQRVEAKLFTPMVFAVGYAQFGALTFALVIVPGLAFVAYRRPTRLFHNPAIAWLESRYRRALDRLLDRPTIALRGAAITAVAVIVLGATVGREFLPELDEGSIWLQVQMPAGLSLRKATEMAADLRRATLEFPEVSYVVTQLGRNDDGTDPWTPSHIEASVGLRPYDSWESGDTKQQLISRMSARYKELSGFDVGFSQPMIDGVNDKISGAHSQLVVKIYGDDFGELRRIAREIVDVLRATPGSADVAIDQEPPLPQIAIKVDREATARYGINVSDIADLIEKGIGGAPVSQIFIGERRYDATVRFSAAARGSPEALGDLTLTSSDGALIPLSQIAKITLQAGESTITREMNRRHLTVKLNYRDRDLSSLLEDARAGVSKKVSFDPRKYQVEWGGQFENQRRAERRLIAMMGLVIGLMIILLYPGFGVLRQALLVLGIVPLATLGGLVAIHATGTTLNVASSVGFIALFGVAIMNGVVMVANLNRARLSGLPLREAVAAGAEERLRPVLMTATVATVGMLPAAVATGVGSDVQRGVGTVVAGGLLTATLLTLFIIPVFYFLLEQRALRRAPRREPEASEHIVQ
ncbi:efflux RND transporter permease subunit [Methylosinus sp. LW4]|uniref:efflux RND transporter permease subunit n=1 Tax=Methylosinus sp. LW4 TaxID=136993 RepID=UPI000378E7FA|nr:CusA/CzcA family heavy metal efflux RND transporter [Methylosinus sp. LW4]